MLNVVSRSYNKFRNFEKNINIFYTYIIALRNDLYVQEILMFFQNLL